MTKPIKPTVPPAPSRANPGVDFSARADAFAAFFGPFADYLDAVGDFTDGRADAALAAALAGDLPPLTGQALNWLRLNAAGTALEWRTPAQVMADLGITGLNRIINAQGRVNQRGYVSGTATTGANQYTLDRWRVVTSGQNLTFTGTDAGRTMTAPAGGCEQVIEGRDIEGGTYVINWTGTATCTVDGIARAKGATFTLAANTNATVRFSGGTFTDVQVELGTVATPFERLPFGDELLRCQRFYYTSGFADPIIRIPNLSGGTTVLHGYFSLPVALRGAPALAASGDISDGAPFTTWDALSSAPDRRSVLFQKNGILTGQFLDLRSLTADAEL